jgi:hypothetical protein
MQVFAAAEDDIDELQDGHGGAPQDLISWIIPLLCVVFLLILTVMLWNGWNQNESHLG